MSSSINLSTDRAQNLSIPESSSAGIKINNITNETARSSLSQSSASNTKPSCFCNCIIKTIVAFYRFFRCIFCCDRLNGHYKITLPNGHCFEGEFVNNKPNGRGKIKIGRAHV